ncbi:MAG: hypothetical protein ABS45_09880 [Comamonas sp. SCN 65-56]|uniref:polysaccharide deacetylase family protein n=1 Tax=Comamonas sp. SCN 65-56 TaxID=1660095 RepID=UPI000868C749|nr:polysaccharide deacetylase family protein [Comamonas sp. SCN 65-56]ODS91789.1 MAG: hypothetical protein ABS45_09880 [Comamonas sp. SCN 65-56]GIK82820.1 MAG: hypothetical protein BroJett024_39250 [Alphaproteobacteria bacterium]
MKPLVLLMYHALYADERELADIDPPDRPYAVSVSNFERQLELIGEAGIPVIDPRTLDRDAPTSGGVVLTFDDGHASNRIHALDRLVRRGYRGAFFVTTDFVGRRPGFSTWGQLVDMHRCGMTIGAHGRTHRFFDDLDDAASRAEFAASRSAIEDALGAEVRQMSFPGGRFRRRQLRFGQEAGFRIFHGSNVGVHRPEPVAAGTVLPRIAVRQATNERRYRDMISAAPLWLFRARLSANAKTLVRRTAGNRIYHALYEKLAG